MWSLVWSPSSFLGRRLRGRRHWPSALAAPALCGLLQGAGALVLGIRTEGALEAALPDRLAAGAAPYRPVVAVAVALGYPLLCCLVILAVLSLNVWARRPGPPDRLAELTALAFYTQVPYCVATLLVAGWWDPPAMPPLADRSAVATLEGVLRYRDAVLAEPLPSTTRLLAIYSLLWLSAVTALALRLTAGLSRGATAVAGAVVGLLCAGAPLTRWLLDLAR